MADANGKMAIRAAQSLLRIHDPSIQVDGIWGRRSTTAFENAPVDLRQVITPVKAYADKILNEVKPASRDGGSWIRRDEALAIISEVSRYSGVPESWLRFMLDMEPSIRRTPRGLEYNTRSVAPSGLYFGLMQIGAPAWTDALSKFPEIGSFESNKFDPRLNVLAAAGYARANMEYAKRIHGYEGRFSPELVYALHNQGHSFMSSAYKGGIGRYASGQSAKAQGVLKNASDQVRQYVANISPHGKAIV